MKLRDYIKIARLKDVVEVNNKVYWVYSLNLCPGISLIDLIEDGKDCFTGWSSKIYFRSNGLLPGIDDELEFKLIKNNNTHMKITNLVKKILDEDTRKLVKAGFINGELALTDEGVAELLGLLFLQNKAELVKIADEKNAENNK